MSKPETKPTADAVAAGAPEKPDPQTSYPTVVERPRTRGLFGALREWGGFVKFSHTLFALPFALASMMVASREHYRYHEANPGPDGNTLPRATEFGFPGLEKFLLILSCLVCARTCALAFNRIVDRKFDALNPRTAGRHLPAGKITLASAWTLCLLSGAGFLVSAGFINFACLSMAPIALFLVCFYSFTKRFTDYSHVFLGVALALAPIGAWLAVKGDTMPELFQLLPLSRSLLPPLLLGTAVVFWLIGFDVIYSLQDYEFDRTHGLHSLATGWGPNNALMAAFLSHMIMWGILVLYGLLLGRPVAYSIGLLIIMVCLALEHWLARKRKTKWINVAFFRLNALISTVYFISVATQIVFPFFSRMELE